MRMTRLSLEQAIRGVALEIDVLSGRQDAETVAIIDAMTAPVRIQELVAAFTELAQANRPQPDPAARPGTLGNLAAALGIEVPPTGTEGAGYGELQRRQPAERAEQSTGERYQWQQRFAGPVGPQQQRTG